MIASFLASCASLCIARFGRFQFLQFIYYLLQCRCCRIFHGMSKTKIFWSGEENVVAKEREAEISSFEVRTIWKFYWFIICILLPLLFLSELILCRSSCKKTLINHFFTVEYTTPWLEWKYWYSWSNITLRQVVQFELNFLLVQVHLSLSKY